MNDLGFILVFFGPLIPAIFVYFVARRIRPPDTADSFGFQNLFGARVHLAGASATYAALVLIALLVHSQVSPSELVSVSLNIELSGDASTVREFTSNQILESKIDVFDNDDQLLVSFERLSKLGESRLTSVAEISRSILGEEAHLKLTPNLHDAQLRPTTVRKLIENLNIDLVFPTKNRIVRCLRRKEEQWQGALTISLIDFEVEPAVDRLQHLAVFVNTTDRRLSEITLSGFKLNGSFRKIGLHVRSLSVEQIQATTIKLGNPDLFRNNSDNAIIRILENIKDEARADGIFIGELSLTADSDGKLIGDPPSGDVALIYNNTTVRIGQIPGGIAPGGSVVVYVDSEITRKYDAVTDPNRKRQIGQRAARPTCLTYLVGRLGDPTLSIDTEKVLTEFELEGGEKTRTHDNVSLRRTERFALLEIEDWAEAAVARLIFEYVPHADKSVQ